MRSNHIAMSLVINAPIEKVWAALADWESQGEWMLQTTVEVTSEIREGVGTSIAAFTGVGKLGVMDYMTVTAWNPPTFCDVVHTGKIIKGTGRFELTALNPQSTRFDWSEEILAPRALFLLIAPGLYVGVRISLSALRRKLQQRK
ncbi:MAG: SRPBCC family protein [Candidatus Planktophila sp.]|nr:SRPBCC family protein [Candidatus Planktophila sp.]